MCVTPSVPRPSWGVSGMGPLPCLYLGIYVGAARSPSSEVASCTDLLHRNKRHSTCWREPLVNKPKDVWWRKVMEAINSWSWEKVKGQVADC